MPVVITFVFHKSCSSLLDLNLYHVFICFIYSVDVYYILCEINLKNTKGILEHDDKINTI